MSLRLSQVDTEYPHQQEKHHWGQYET
jgi:hypothetical protein